MKFCQLVSTKGVFPANRCEPGLDVGFRKRPLDNEGKSVQCLINQVSVVFGEDETRRRVVGGVLMY